MTMKITPVSRCPRRLNASLVASLVSALLLVALAPTVARAQAKPAAPAPGDATLSKEAKAATPVTEEPVQLSPFEINESTNGYYAANTMSGTRLNSKIED